MKAKLQWFDDRKGFGFAKTDEGRTVFCHWSDIKGEGHKSLPPDAIIEFDLYEDFPGQYRARNIKIWERE